MPAPQPVRHVVWIWMENHSAPDVIGNVNAPYESELAQKCGSATTYQNVGSPSLPNYLAATSGDIQEVHDDGDPAAHPITSDNLFRQVRAAGADSKSYEESMPEPCALTGSGQYAVRHNPAAYYTGGDTSDDDRAACARDNVSFDAFDPNALPTFAFITPNLCHDTHDCPVPDGDAWLREIVPRITTSAEYQQGNTVVFIAWDEPTPMPLLVLGPSVKAGATPSATQQVDHYALLRTTEELLGLPLLGNAQTATSMRAAFNL
jgi:hypothetical protein